MGAAADKLQKRLDLMIETACKMLVREIYMELRKPPPLGTPVDTRHARVNWVPSVGAPFSGEVDGDSGAAYAAGVAEIGRYKIANGTLYITNNTPYIRKLNEGSSKQSPALFVEAAIERAIATVKAKMNVDFGRIGDQRQVVASE